MRGFIAGFLSLTILEALVSSSSAVQNATGVFGLLTKGIARIVDPTVPLIPDRRGPGQVILAN